IQQVKTSHTFLQMQITPWMELKVILIQDGYGLKDKYPGAPPLTTFTVTFERPGIYDYVCTVHPWMTGSVEVT
ncbi:MAG: cupredoxin domain-containing protein, partial [Nitrososphaeraceae archaeon]